AAGQPPVQVDRAAVVDRVADRREGGQEATVESNVLVAELLRVEELGPCRRRDRHGRRNLGSIEVGRKLLVGINLENADCVLAPLYRQADAARPHVEELDLPTLADLTLNAER